MNPVVYISPNTTVDICRGVPIPQNYEHVLSFSSEAATYAAFTTFIKYQQQKCTPVRLPSAIRVPFGINNLTDCNYIIFSNYNSGENRIYAFITDITYVNQNCSDIHYQIDVWTTNYSKMNFGRCFVEREHVIDDSYGLHTIPEGLETGDFVSNDLKSLKYDVNYTCILYSPPSSDEVKGYIINNIYTGLKAKVIKSKAEGLIEDALKECTQDWQYPERVVAIFHYPSFMGDLSNPTVGSLLSDILKPSNLNGYIPKNNKCFTGEFCFLLADDMNGNTSVYQFENADTEGHNITFRMCGTFITMPVLNTYPLNYKGMSNCFMEGITTTNFPNCAWVSEAFAQWWAQNKASMTAQSIGSALNVVTAGLLGAASGGTAGAAMGIASSSVSAIHTVLNQTAQKYTKSQQPAQIHGQTQLDSLNVADGRLFVNFYTMSVKNEVARQIDSFFEVFGYRINELKIPNITGRPYWNYVKTANAVVSGNLYMNTTSEIENILNNGVTIWHNINNIGNYSLNNH